MDQQDVSSETLAAQGLGEADPVSGGLAPVINLSTNYEQEPDGSYRQGRVYTRGTQFFPREKGDGFSALF